MLTYTDRKDSQAEPVSAMSQAHSSAAAERPDSAENQERCPVPRIVIFSVACHWGQSEVGMDWFMACLDGMPGLPSK